MEKKSAVELAKEKAKKKRKEEEEREAKKKAEADINESNRKYWLKLIGEVVNQFDGMKNISVKKGDSYRSEWNIYKGKTRIVNVEFCWMTWEDPNYDYKVTEEGYGAKITKYPDEPEEKYDPFYPSRRSEKSRSQIECHYSSYFEEYFADVMSDFI